MIAGKVTGSPAAIACAIASAPIGLDAPGCRISGFTDLAAIATPAAIPPPPMLAMTSVVSGTVFHDLEAHSSLSRYHKRVVKRMNEYFSLLLRVRDAVKRGGDIRLEALPGAVTSRRVEIILRRILGHRDHGVDAESLAHKRPPAHDCRR